MDIPILALIVSLCATALVVISYFVRSKEKYLFFQALCLISLSASYFFTVQFFAMVGLAIAVTRVLVFYAYEKQDKTAPIWLATLFSVAMLAAYLIVNVWILQTARPIDLMLVISNVFYTFIFRIRSLKTVRFTILIPTVMSLLYNTASGAALGATLVYVFELSANVVSIFRFHILGERVHNQKIKENTHENG